MQALGYTPANTTTDLTNEQAAELVAFNHGPEATNLVELHDDEDGDGGDMSLDEEGDGAAQPTTGGAFAMIAHGLINGHEQPHEVADELVDADTPKGQVMSIMAKLSDTDKQAVLKQLNEWAGYNPEAAHQKKLVSTTVKPPKAGTMKEKAWQIIAKGKAEGRQRKLITVDLMEIGLTEQAAGTYIYNYDKEQKVLKAQAEQANT